MEKFINDMNAAYQAKGQAITLGAALLGGQVVAQAAVRCPVAMLNRHGLIAGATGTGKTKTIQVLAEQCSEAGIPAILMDLKGDLSGLAVAGEENDKIMTRHAALALPYQPQAFPVELLSISNQPGVQCRLSVQDFGPTLFAKLLNLNETQSGLLAVLFKYCADQQLELIDLNDLKAILQFASDAGKSSIEQEYGKLSTASLGSILRRVVALESQGGDCLFGEPAIKINELLATDHNGWGKINILRLTDSQDKPQLFSCFMISLLTRLYQQLPEVGDANKPKVMLFIDEAHLIFKDASKTLLNQIESTVKLIRSKGVGIIFCTQTPRDIPEAVLSQLGLKIQHALRAFTAKDRKAIKLIAENYPASEYYDTTDCLVSLGIGEALVTCLDEKAQPTMLAATYLRAPMSRMGVLDAQELNQAAHSELAQRYANRVDRVSATEQLAKQLAAGVDASHDPQRSKKNGASSVFDNTLFRRVVTTIVREVSRSIMKILTRKR